MVITAPICMLLGSSSAYCVKRGRRIPDTLLEADSLIFGYELVKSSKFFGISAAIWDRLENVMTF